MEKITFTIDLDNARYDSQKHGIVIDAVIGEPVLLMGDLVIPCNRKTSKKIIEYIKQEAKNG